MYRVQLTVPSTKNISEQITTDEFQSRELEVIGLFSDEFGGATAIDAIGGWKSGNKVVTESVKQVYSWADKVNIDKLRGLAQSLAKKWGQEAIMLEIDNKVYFEEAK